MKIKREFDNDFTKVTGKNGAVIQEGSVVGDAFGASFVARESKQWDGYIHPSALDWNSAPETQYKKLYTKGDLELQDGSALLKNFAQGDLLHLELCKRLQPTLKGDFEVGFINKEIRFMGTADWIVKIPGMGTCLLDFKTFNPLSRDKARAKQLLTKEKIELTGELLDRVNSSERVMTEPDQKHLTQVFTYAYIFNMFTNNFRFDKIDTVGVIYLNKSEWAIKEFYLKLSDNQALLEKAANNYVEVLKLVISGERNG
jgi:hypothetical protein